MQADVLQSFWRADMNSHSIRCIVLQASLNWRVPNGWSGWIFGVSSSFGPLGKCFQLQADDSQMRCAA